MGLADRHRLPTIYFSVDFVEAGGLASYSSSATEVSHALGSYVARVLSGARPADLPVLEPTAIELVINLGAARRLDLAVPPSLLARAERVIE